MTDSYGAFEDGREASDDSSDVGLLCRCSAAAEMMCRARKSAWHKSP